MNTIVARYNNDGKWNYWEERKISDAASILFASLFGVGAILHLYQLWRYRAWHFSAFVFGAFMMSIGYIFRYISYHDPYNLGPYVIQILFILLPPSLYAATIYMIYGRIVILVDAAHLSLIRPTWVTKIFVCSDLLAFIVQSSGGSMLTMEGQENTGKNILLIGLYVQLASFAFFLCVSAMFYIRVRRAEVDVPKYGRYDWVTMLKVLYFSAACIIARCIFRVVEFSASKDSTVQRDEVWGYCFDSVPMFVVQCVFNIVHGGMVFPRGGVKKRAGDGSQYELSRGSGESV